MGLMFGIILAVIGIVVVGAILLVAYVALKMKTHVTPARIHVVPVDEARWKRVEDFAKNREAAIGLGFNDLGSFNVPEMPGVVLNAFVKPSEASYCMIYEHPQVGMWTEFVTRFDDGCALSVSNAPLGGELDTKPGNEKVTDKSKDLAGLYELMLRERDKSNFLTLSGSREEFISIFERAYADLMDWRNSRGGATAEEIKKVAQNTGKDYSDDVIRLTEVRQNEIACQQLIPAFEERLKESKNYSDQQWQEIQPKLIFVHDNLSSNMVRNLLRDNFPEVDDIDLPEGQSVRALFSKLNSQLPHEKQVKVLATLEKPLETDVYVRSMSN